MGDGAGELIDTIHAAAGLVDRDLPADPRELGELLRHLEAARTRLDAAADAMLDRFDRDCASQWDGLRTTNGWLTQHTPAAGATAARRVRRVRALRQLPIIAERYRTGRLSADQVDAFVRVLNPRTADAMTTDEQLLADLADHLRVDDLARELRGWAELVDADGTEPDPGHTDRRVTLHQTLDGTWTGRIDLGAADGTTVDAAISTLADQYSRDDRTGVGPTRSPAQRRADALVELIRRGAAEQSAPLSGDSADTPPAAPPSVRRLGPRVELHLTLDAGDLEAGRGADTLDGIHLDPAATDLLLCDAIITGVLTDPLGGAVLHRGRSLRTATPAQRRALALETGGCGFPGCDAPPEHCDAHHIVHWRRGGLTDLPNLVLVCWYHHHLLHDGGWRVTKAVEGTLTWSRPDSTTLDPTPHRTPLRLINGGEGHGANTARDCRATPRTTSRPPPRRRADPA